MLFFKKYLEINERYWFSWHFFIHFLHCWNWLLFQCLSSIWAFSNRIFQWNVHYFWPKKDSFFVKNWRLRILFRIDNRLLTLNSWEKVLWASKHHFWEVHFLWRKSNVKSKNEKHYSFFKNQINHCQMMIWKRNVISHFLDFLKNDVWQPIETFLKKLEPINDYQF